MPPLLNYLGFQLGWFACVGGAGRGLYYLGPLVCVPLLAGHLAVSPRRGNELKRLLAVTIFGLVLELTALSLGRHRFIGPGMIPLWVVSLWLLLAATLNSSFAWLSKRPVLAAVLGAVAGPLSFKAGVGLGAGAYLVSPASASVVLGAQWALALPGAFVVSSFFARRTS
jgi:hypothetical protein